MAMLRRTITRMMTASEASPSTNEAKAATSKMMTSGFRKRRSNSTTVELRFAGAGSFGPY